MRRDPNRFLIGVYCFGHEFLHDEAHICELNSCGVNFVIGVPSDAPRAVFDALQRHNMGCVAGGVLPGWWGGNGERAGKMRALQPVKMYEDALREFKEKVDHPAIWMIDLSDEPSAKDMPYLGELCELIAKRCPDSPAYLNLYPNYAVGSWNTGKQTIDQLGTATYEEHIDVYDKSVKLPYLSYDHYIYFDDPTRTKRFVGLMYDNYRVVSECCRKSGRDFWYIPQVNVRPKSKKMMTEQKLRYQAFTAMAYGAVAINWACWSPGWWDMNVYNCDGRRNDAVYTCLQNVNREIHALATDYMRYRNVATRGIWCAGGSSEYADSAVSGLKATDSSALLIGEMLSRDAASSARALFIAATNDPEGEKHDAHRVVFKATRKIVSARSNEGDIAFREAADGTYSFMLRDNDCAFIQFA